jgi:hypothetical protein
MLAILNMVLKTLKPKDSTWGWFCNTFYWHLDAISLGLPRAKRAGRNRERIASRQKNNFSRKCFEKFGILIFTSKKLIWILTSKKLISAHFSCSNSNVYLYIAMQCLFSQLFTTYEWLNWDCDVQIYIGITSRWTGYKSKTTTIFKKDIKSKSPKSDLNHRRG